MKNLKNFVLSLFRGEHSKEFVFVDEASEEAAPDVVPPTPAAGGDTPPADPEKEAKDIVDGATGDLDNMSPLSNGLKELIKLIIEIMKAIREAKEKKKQDPKASAYPTKGEMDKTKDQMEEMRQQIECLKEEGTLDEKQYETLMGKQMDTDSARMTWETAIGGAKESEETFKEAKEAVIQDVQKRSAVIDDPIQWGNHEKEKAMEIAGATSEFDYKAYEVGRRLTLENGKLTADEKKGGHDEEYYKDQYHELVKATQEVLHKELQKELQEIRDDKTLDKYTNPKDATRTLSSLHEEWKDADAKVEKAHEAFESSFEAYGKAMFDMGIDSAVNEALLEEFASWFADKE